MLKHIVKQQAARSPRQAKGRAANWLARSGSVAPQQVLSSILIRSEFPVVGVKQPPRCARREAWPSRAWTRVRGFLYPDKPVWLHLNEKNGGAVSSPCRVFLLSCDGLRIKPSMVFYRLLCYIALT